MGGLIEFEQVNKTLGQTRILDNFSFSIEENKIFCIIGPSGCGKTTILQMLAGLEQPDRGLLKGLTGKRVSYVFQEPRLLPWKTVAGNLDFILRDELPPAKKDKLIDHYLKIMGLDGYRNSYPKALSGGMKQRLAICRAFAYPHDILLLDEPFKSLDTPMRLGLVRHVIKLWQTAPRTIVFVTHDIIEALLLGHRIMVLAARPTEILEIIDLDMPHDQRHMGEELLGSLYTKLLDLLDKENKKYFPEL
ncbi:Aliphatic sulfonates import ATP-binding protein SsuB [Sporotomaculum syntrophicum]|uniref:Aliphatic sulfonates import ATP-binding protein SsuB n=1 Tax=Sporotomaculum syntrophicum TaxID=182264 RepID=A0A9D3AVZ9_9FIRM|nr:Aliphatic sulfonates import ATP-binding protein SsuB [Sporotomaculum syntrophicum]